jgi:hypothetical protein
MIQVFRGGRSAEPAAPPRETRLIARPFFLMNHWGTRVLLLRLMDPWPRSRIEKNPTNRVMGLFTRLMPRQANPNMSAMAVVTALCPRRSMKLPTNPIRRPAARVPIEYMPETVDRLQPNSPMYESMKVETLYVCPGPEKNIVRAETPTMIHP